MSPPGWVWTTITVTATSDIHLSKERLGHDRLGAPRLEHWRLDIAKDRAVSLNLPKHRRVQIGDTIDIADIANCFDLSSDWKRDPE